MTGLDAGHWTTQCESWFTNRLAKIKEGKALPMKPKEWQSSLKFNKRLTRPFLSKLEEVSYYCS